MPRHDDNSIGKIPTLRVSPASRLSFAHAAALKMIKKAADQSHRQQAAYHSAASKPTPCKWMMRWLQLLLSVLLANISITVSLNPTKSTNYPSNCGQGFVCDRKTALVSAAVSIFPIWGIPLTASARSPGSSDIAEAVTQIRDASADLRKLSQNWSEYAVINAEGRAGDNTVGARRILGGVAPQAGSAAIEAAKATPLYRIDGAFNAVRKYAIDADDGSWGSNLDLETFEDIGERLLFAIQKADGDFYSVVFAAKGTTQLTNIYRETKEQVDQGIIDFDKMLDLLRIAGAPGF